MREHALERHAAAVRQLSNGTSGGDLCIRIATAGNTIQTVNSPMYDTYMGELILYINFNRKANVFNDIYLFQVRMVRFVGHLEVVVVEARNLQSRNVINPYCIVELVGPKSSNEIGKTMAIEDHNDPRWMSTITHDVDAELIEIRFIVKDKSLFKDDKIGSCSVNASCLSADTYVGTLDLNSKKVSNAGQLHVKIKFSDAGQFRRPSKLDKIKGCVHRKVTDDPFPPSRLLHGTLKVTVLKAEGLPNFDSSLLNRKNKSDPFVLVGVQDVFGDTYKLSRTNTIDNNLNPEWNEKFSLPVCHDVAFIVFVVYDEDVMKHDKMCSVEIPVDELTDGRTISGEQQLLTHKNKDGGKLFVTLLFTPYSDVSSFVVPNCSFLTRRENKVKLYKEPKSCPQAVQVMDFARRPYTLRDGWNDVHETLSGAKKFICIVGWSLNASITLGKSDGSESETIGKILLEKADEGVDVRVLLWNDADTNAPKKDTAKEFFKESLVKVELISRKKQKKEPFFFKDNAYTKHCFSHSQKFILADQSVEESPGLRNIVAYVGSFDLSNGRSDASKNNNATAETESKNQFVNNIIATITKSTSRTPCHEVFCKVIGPAALDIYENFRGRWSAEGLSAESDFDLEKSSGIYTDYTYESVDAWDVQVYRSICHDSIDLEESDKIHFYGGTKTDNSLYRAYIHQVQKARQFIYMETASFMGSSHFWDDCSDIQIKNLIPIEITMKILDAIKKNKSFRVFILLSMYPESNPEDSVSQEIIHWQYHTIDMMYRRIAEAIEEKGLDTEPQDYLLFLCLGKREEAETSAKLLKQQPSLDVPQAPVTKQKRSIIAVNSKIAIFDDEYIIVGSANMNDRSLVGNRNTELAIGAYQPRLAAVGEISTFRKSLWVEYMGKDAPIDMDPGSIDCIRKVRELGEETLKCYVDTSLPLPNSNLLLYPISVEGSGVVSVRSDCEKFPDSKVIVLGARSKVIPISVTT